MERAIYLHGDLAKKYGKEPIMITAETTLLVMQGLFCKLGQKFKERIRNGKFHVYKGKRNKKDDMGENEVAFTLGNTKEIHLVPVIEGKSAVARIIIGVVLIVIGYFFPVLAPYLYPMGASLIFGGVAELLAPKPQLSAPTTQAGQNPSFIFNGTVNVTEQGGPVPVILGRMRRASCVVLSAGLTVENVPL
jgi:predicted phage tail protein